MAFRGSAFPVSLLVAAASCAPHPVAERAAPTPLAPTPPAVEAPVVRVDATSGHALNAFAPIHALGVSIDRVQRGSTDALYSPSMVGQILSAGWGAVSYRLNTELHVEAWHWNPHGTWSDGNRGYFTGSADVAEPIRHSFGYPLPRRGFTRNEGTENEGYSRLTDGDPKSFWKSNPYLASAFTGEADSAFPQWIVIDLGEAREVDAIRIAWAAPYARRYRIQYWTGDDAIKKPAAGQWKDFPSGAIEKASGGSVTHKLAPAPLPARFVRVEMIESSGTCDARAAGDRRNCVGFAISEVQLGTIAGGTLHDLVRHEPTQSQTTTYCSSVDPWHQPTDIDEERGEQTGFDLFFTSGVTRGLPAMVPVAVLYGTPDDAAAQIAYLRKRGYPLSYVELGEEPDGQYMTPEHYAAMYLQWAAAIHRVDPTSKLGGPVFTGVNEDIKAWPDAAGNTSWLGRFLAYLKAHGRAGDLAFMSFEHYPYEPCKVTWESLYDEPRLITQIMQAWRDDGLPADVPMLATEVNIAWQSNVTFVDLFGGLWLADFIGAFYSAGGRASAYFQYFPEQLSRSCDDTYGGFTMFKADAAHRVEQPLAQYFAAQLVTQDWVQPGDRIHRVFPASSEVKDATGRTVVTAYALERPDEQWSVLLVNKDPLAARTVRVVFHDADAQRDRSFAGDVAVATFGADNYVWHPNGPDGRADPDGPIGRTSRPASTGVFELPKASATVVRGTIR
jgi:hypothetical protein